MYSSSSKPEYSLCLTAYAMPSSAIDRTSVTSGAMTRTVAPATEYLYVPW